MIETRNKVVVMIDDSRSVRTRKPPSGEGGLGEQEREERVERFENSGVHFNSFH